jgi:hypothetical protein
MGWSVLTAIAVSVLADLASYEIQQWRARRRMKRTPQQVGYANQESSHGQRTPRRRDKLITARLLMLPFQVMRDRDQDQEK